MAPGLTPNRITPPAGSPGPAVVPDFLTLSNAGAYEDRLSPSPSVLSTSLSPKPHNVEDNDEIDELLQYGNTMATSVDNQENIDERAVGSYYDPVAAVGLLLPHLLVIMSEISIFVDVTIHATEDTTVESTEGVEVIGARITGEEIYTAWPKSDLEPRDRDADRMQEILSVPPSDDEHTDNDGEEDDGKSTGLLPLGTSDLDIRDDWRDSGRRKEIDDIPEEVALTLSKVATPDALNGTWAIRYVTLPNR